MKHLQESYAIAALLVLGQPASGIEYQKSVIAGAGMTNRSTFVSLEFLDSVARVCGLALRFEKDKLVFEKLQDKAMSTGIDGSRREPTEDGP